MSLLEINPAEIQGFKFTKYGKINKTSLQNLMNQGNDAYGFVEMQLFGINHVYTLIDFNKVNNFNLLKIKNECAIPLAHFLERSSYNINLLLAKIIDDCPLEKDVNMKSNIISLDSFNLIEWIILYQLKNAINGMNTISNERYNIVYAIEFGETVEDNTCPFNLSKLDFRYYGKDIEYPFYNYKYILRYPNNDFEFCNEIYNDDFEGVFIYISEFDCWQYLSTKKYRTLKQTKQIDIVYATTDSPICFSNVKYHQEYNIDTFIDLILSGIYIPMEIYLNKVFENSIEIDHSNKRYDAIEIRIEGREYQTSVLLTYTELGINQTFGTKENNRQNPFESNNISNNVRYIDKFCLLKLINKIILLKP